jgi:hypothetical protein
VCVCSFSSYPARNAHAPCNIFICGLSDSSTFFHIISKTTRFSEKKFCVFWLPLQILSEMFVILRRREQRLIIKVYFGFHVKYRYSCHISMKAAFTDRFSKNTHISKFSQGEPSCSMRTDRQTDGHIYDEANSRFSQFLQTRLKIFHFNFNGFYIVQWLVTVWINSIRIPKGQ